MRGILIRVDGNESEAVTALKIINYFDELSVQPRLDLMGLAIAAAALAECPVGIGTQTGQVFTSTAAAEASPPDPVPGRTARSTNGQTVWLERAGNPEATDALILERCAIAADVVLDRLRHRPTAGLGDPEVLHALLTGSTVPKQVIVEQFGVSPRTKVCLIAMDSESPDDAAAEILALLVRAKPTTQLINVSVVDGLGVGVVHEDANAQWALDLQGAVRNRYGERDSPVRCGISRMCTVEELPVAWGQAKVALRFSVSGAAEQSVTSFDQLGPLTLLADMPVEQLKAHPDVAALSRLEATSTGVTELKILDVFCQVGSLRLAAQSLHLHHSSVASRLSHVEDVLGWTLDTPDGRFRARLAILAGRLTAAAR